MRNSSSLSLARILHTLRDDRHGAVERLAIIQQTDKF